MDVPVVDVPVSEAAVEYIPVTSGIAKKGPAVTASAAVAPK